MNKIQHLSLFVGLSIGMSAVLAASAVALPAAAQTYTYSNSNGYTNGSCLHLTE